MRKADLQRCCRQLIEEISEINSRARLVRDAKRVLGRVPDKRWAYEALAVNAVTVWSTFAEEIFYASINRDSSVLAERLELTLPKHLSLPLCEALFTTRGYLDFRGFGDLKDHARQNLGQHHLSTAILPATANGIEELMKVRNYIVHPGRVSRARYKTKVLEPHGVRRIIYPGAFLLARTAGKTRLERYLDAVEAAGKAILERLG